MNLESLNKHLCRVAKYEWNDEVIYLRKIGATDGMAYYGRFKELAGKTLSEVDDRTETIATHADMISKSMAGEDGQLTLDTDEGRAALKNIAFDELVSLGLLVLRHSGFSGDQPKKNSPTRNVLNTNSASPSESCTPITLCGDSPGNSSQDGCITTASDLGAT